MLNPIEKFKSSILHLNRNWNHCIFTKKNNNLDNFIFIFISSGIEEKNPCSDPSYIEYSASGISITNVQQP